MAFSTSNIRKDYFGSLKVMAGNFSSNAADANGSIAVEGGNVYLAEFSTEDSSSPAPTLQLVPFSVSTSGSTTTLTVYSTGKTTTGRFLIIYA